MPNKEASSLPVTLTRRPAYRVINLTTCSIANVVINGLIDDVMTVIRSNYRGSAHVSFNEWDSPCILRLLEPIILGRSPGQAVGNQHMSTWHNAVVSAVPIVSAGTD
jgi:hypothetical protein